jgi:hypothetical protein
VLKSAQIQKRSADDPRQWRVRYDLLDHSNWFFLHAYHLFDITSLFSYVSKRGQEKGQSSQDAVKRIILLTASEMGY